MPAPTTGAAVRTAKPEDDEESLPPLFPEEPVAELPVLLAMAVLEEAVWLLLWESLT